jgi:hypothetical protein
MLASQGHGHGQGQGQGVLDVLVRMVFVDNPPGRGIDIALPCVEDGRALFMFCLDLLSRGMMIMAGGRWDDPVVDLTRLRLPEFERASERLRCLGVAVELASESLVEEGAVLAGDRVLLMLACSEPEDAVNVPLTACRAIMVIEGRAHCVAFRLFHYTGGAGGCGALVRRTQARHGRGA